MIDLSEMKHLVVVKDSEKTIIYINGEIYQVIDDEEEI